MTKCNVCDCPDSTLLVEKNGYKVYQCIKCRLAFTYPQPKSLEEQYNESYFELYRKRRDFRLKRASARLSVIELIMPPGRLLDIGCSLGYFVEAGISRGWDAKGIELSPYASQAARESGLDVITGSLENANYPDNSFDCITMWDVLEHIPDPTAHLREIHRILADGGLLVMGTPNLNHALFRLKREQWRHLKPTEHIYYFQESNLNLLLEKTNFKPVKPPIFGGRTFADNTQAAIGEAIRRLVNPKDVMTIYGVKV